MIADWRILDSDQLLEISESGYATTFWAGPRYDRCAPNFGPVGAHGRKRVKKMPTAVRF